MKSTLYLEQGLYTNHPVVTTMEMELDLEGLSILAEGNVEIELPSYMTMLPSEELAEAKQAVQRDQMIVAAGRKSDTDEIVMMTAVGNILSLQTQQFGIPFGRVIPIDFGHTVVVETSSGYFEMAADWLIENSATIDLTVAS